MEVKQKLLDSVTDQEQRIFIKFCTMAGYSASVTLQHLRKSIGGNAFDIKTVEKWQTKFRKGETETKEARGGARTNIEEKEQRMMRIEDMLRESKQHSVRIIAQILDIPKSSVHRIITGDLGLIKKLGRFVPHDLSHDQRQHRVLACQANLSEYKKHKDKLLHTLALDESWVGLYMEPQKDQLRSWVKPGEAGPSAPRQPTHGDKRMLLVAMDYNGIAWYHLCEEKQTVTADVYKSILSAKIPNQRRGRSSVTTVLLHDNAKPHKAQTVQSYLKDSGIAQWMHPPYSPDLSPCDYGCFGPLKRALRGIKHQDWDHFVNRLEEEIREGNQNGRYNGVQSLPERWQRVIYNEGDYI